MRLFGGQIECDHENQGTAFHDKSGIRVKFLRHTSPPGGWERGLSVLAINVILGIETQYFQSIQTILARGYCPEKVLCFSFLFLNPGHRPHLLLGSAPGSLCNRFNQYLFSSLFSDILEFKLYDTCNHRSYSLAFYSCSLRVSFSVIFQRFTILEIFLHSRKCQTLGVSRQSGGVLIN